MNTKSGIGGSGVRSEENSRYTESQLRALRLCGAFDTRPESVKQADAEARRNRPQMDWTESAKAARAAGYDVEY